MILAHAGRDDRNKSYRRRNHKTFAPITLESDAR